MLDYRMAENIILAIAFFTLTLAGLTSPRGLHYDTGTIPPCYGLKSKHEFSNFSVGQIIPSDDHLNICVNNGTTCCTRLMEQRLHKLSQDNVRNIQAAKTDLIKKIFGEGVIKLKEFFEDHIDSSERELDQEFTRVYRKAYANNSYLTKSFYYKLRRHYKNGEYKINKIVNDFFKEVLKKMYLLLNGGVSTDVDMDCVGSTYDKLDPFGRVPRDLIPRLERSITAARTMIYGLLSGKSVVEKLSDDRWFSEKCFNSVTKMSQCSVCSGYSNLKPCVGYCINVYAECLSLFTELEKDWGDYIFYLSSLGYQLDGSFDFEAVTGELPYDISSGIMNCQRALMSKLLPKITKLCKKGKVRTQRSVISSDNNDFFLEKNERVQRSLETSRRKPRFTLGKLLEQYQKHFEKLKKFWSKLPNAMCDETVVANNATKYCWDGFKIVNNTLTVQRRNLNKTRYSGQNDVTIVSLISQLQTTIKNLKDAVDGRTVNPPTIPGTDTDSSGSASGSGSGDGYEVDEESEEIIPNEVPEEKIELSKPSDPDDNNVEINEVPVERPEVKSRETGRGRASYRHTSLVLLLTALLVHLV